MTYVTTDGRQGYLTCDHSPQCPNRSGEFVPYLGGSLPEGWVDTNRFGARTSLGPLAPRRGHLCPEHAGLETPAT